jgi:quercetin dioxygenase-like cupin family protein
MVAMHDTPDRTGHRTTTSGSDTRPARTIDRAFGVVDLEAETATLLDEPEWADGDRNTRTLLTGDRMRIALTALRTGAALGDDSTNDMLSIQVLRGRVTVESEMEPRDVTAGGLMTLLRPESWRVRATDDAILLLTTALGASPGER